MLWRAKALDGGVTLDHGLSHIVTGWVGIEAAMGRGAIADDGRQPCGVGSGPGSGDAPEVRMYVEAADGIDGGFTEDDPAEECITDGEVAEILS